jgi:hypothetical protein
MYLYKVAKERKNKEMNISEEALLAGALSQAPIFGSRFLGGLGYGFTGDTKHPFVGLFLGPAGVMGARAKDQDASYLRDVLIGGAAAGALNGQTSLLGGRGLVGGALYGTLSSGAEYGLGRVLGTARNKKKK